MARPIGIFSVLMALGGYLAVRYVQNKQAGRFPSARELHRWEDEGGTVLTPASASVSSAPGASQSPKSNGDDRPWPFPRS